jgi:ketosteroid isomerase-like protein
MKTEKQICLLAIFVFAIAGCSQAQTGKDGAIRLKITSLEESWYEAFKARDTKAVDSILDERVLLVNDDGSIQTKGEFLAAMKYMFSRPAAQRQHVSPESLDIKVFGTTAVAIGVMWVEGIEHGKPYKRRERFLDTWKYKDGFWLIIGTEATPVLH